MVRQGAPALRGQGKRAGLDLDQIVDAVRRLGGAGLTMQAVADELGVDRKTINHYVGDRERLLRLAALGAFRESTSSRELPGDLGWPELCRLFSTMVVDGLLAAGEFARHLTVDADFVASVVDPLELLATRMADAGFDDEMTVRCLAQVTNLCMSFANDVSAAGGEGPTRPELLRAGLGVNQAHSGRSESEHPTLSRIASGEIDTYDRAQFDLSIDVFIAGTEAIVSRRARG